MFICFCFEAGLFFCCIVASCISAQVKVFVQGDRPFCRTGPCEDQVCAFGNGGALHLYVVRKSDRRTIIRARSPDFSKRHQEASTFSEDLAALHFGA